MGDEIIGSFGGLCDGRNDGKKAVFYLLVPDLLVDFPGVAFSKIHSLRLGSRALQILNRRI
ncbi:MAG: hypothetical protein ACI9OU_000562 [Candidatus Promineifilaceae bacterium]